MNMPANGLRAYEAAPTAAGAETGKQVVNPYAFPAGDTAASYGLGAWFPE